MILFGVFIKVRLINVGVLTLNKFYVKFLKLNEVCFVGIIKLKRKSQKNIAARSF